MAGRKSSRNGDRVSVQKAERKSAILSPHNDLRERLLETAIDVKENIPERTSSTRNESVGSQRSDCSESRKRHSTEKGPSAKRHSSEKHGSTSRDDSFSSVFSEDRETESSSSTISSRTRSQPLPVMEEEDEVLEMSSDHHAESEVSCESPRSEDGDSDYIEEEDQEEHDESSERNEEIEDEEVDVVGDYDEENEEDDSETEDEDDLPVQNVDFAVTKRLMNDDHLIEPPSLLSIGKCQGIGSPTKVWSLMVKRDDIPRATHLLLEKHPKMTISMRRLLVDWMQEVCESEKLHRETFHLAVDYVDRYLEVARDECSRDTFQLVGTAALFVAAKYEEIYPPKCTDFASLTDGAFTADHIRQMEVLLVKEIGWSLGPITSIQWLSTYLQLLGTGKNDDRNDDYTSNMYVPEFLRSEYMEMCKILDYLLSEIESFKFTYRTIAAAVLFVNYEPRSAVERATGFVYEQLQNVIDYVRPICRAFARYNDVNDLRDEIPDFSPLNSDDSHNIQVHIKQGDIDPFVERERDFQRTGPSRRL